MWVEKRIKKILAKQLDKNIKDIQNNSDLIKDLKIDSMDIMELIIALETEFNIQQIPYEEIEKKMTVGRLVSYIKKQINKK